MDIIQKGISKGLINLDENKKQITYIHQNKKRNYNNPEEKVQAETFVKLVLSYNYPVKQIKLFVSVPMGSTKKEADIVIYKDTKCTKPHIIVECKKKEVSEQEFQQAIGQAASYSWAMPGASKYLLVTTGIKKEAFVIYKENNEINPVADIPKYGDNKISPYKYVKGGRKKDDELIEEPKNKEDEIKNKYFDIETVTESDLTNRFKQAHNSLWAGGELNPSSAFDDSEFT